MKNKLYLALKLIVSGLILFFLFTRVDFSELRIVFARLNFFYYLLAFIIFLSCWYINAVKWKILLVPFNLFLKIKELYYYILLSLFYSVFFPGGQFTGEVGKCFHIIKRYGQKSNLVTSVLHDKVTGLIGFVVLGFLALVFDVTNPIKNKVLVFFAAILLFYILMLTLTNIKKFKEYYLKIIQKYAGRKLYSFFELISKLIWGYQGQNRTIFIALILSVLFQFFNSLGVYLLAIALGINISLLTILWIYALVSILLVIPITISGLGLRDGSFIYFLGLFGVANEIGLALSLSVFSLFLIVALMGGFLYLTTSYKNLCSRK